MPQKILGVVILAIFSAQDALPQVCGLSASKIGACNATPVPAHSLEFEPVFTSLWSNRLWDEQARNLPRFESPDSIEHITHLCFRASYGISKNLEAGLYMSSDLSGIGFAGKYRFLQQDQQEFALLLGYHHKGQGTGDEDTGLLHELESSLAMGLAWTRRLHERLSIDADLQFEQDLGGAETGNSIYLNSDAGYYLSPGFQVIGGFSYSHSHDPGQLANSELWTVNLGASIETGNDFILVFGFPVCVFGRNELCYQGFFFAITLLFD